MQAATDRGGLVDHLGPAKRVTANIRKRKNLMPVFPIKTRCLPAALILALLMLPSLACVISGSPSASPTPTATDRPTSTPTPTVTPTFAPIATPQGLLEYDQRSEFSVTLRSVDAAVHEHFYAISGYLHARGYETDIDSFESNIGDMDILLYGAPACTDALDDLVVILEGRLDITGLKRQRFASDDAYYNWKHLVIQIKSINLFSPYL
jgi:hypothetical protein